MELFYTGILAGLALVFKAGLLLQVVTISNLSRAFNLVTIGFIAQHAFEFLALMTYQTQPALSEIMVNGVLLSAYFICASFLQLALTVNPIGRAREYTLLGWVAFAAMSATHLFGGVVSGILETSYSVITTPGPKYSVAQAFIIYSIFLVALTIAHGAIKGDTKVRRLSSYIAASMFPIAIAAGAVVSLRMAGYQSSSAMVLPIASTYFVWRLMHFELGAIAPFTLKWSVFWFQIRQAIVGVLWRQDRSVSELYADLELHRIRTAMPLCDYNVAAASRLLNTSWSNVDRKCKQYGISDPALKANSLPESENDQRQKLAQ